MHSEMGKPTCICLAGACSMVQCYFCHVCCGAYICVWSDLFTFSNIENTLKKCKYDHEKLTLRNTVAELILFFILFFFPPLNVTEVRCEQNSFKFNSQSGFCPQSRIPSRRKLCWLALALMQMGHLIPSWRRNCSRVNRGEADVFLVQICSSDNAVLCTMCAPCHGDPAIVRGTFFKHTLQHSRALVTWMPITTFYPSWAFSGAWPMPNT